MLWLTELHATSLNQVHKNTVYQIIEKKAWILTTLSSFGKTSSEAEQGEKRERRMSHRLIKWSL